MGRVTGTQQEGGKSHVSGDRVSWGQETGWDGKQKPQNLIGRNNGMAPTGLPQPRLCQFDWTQLKGKKENANKKK